MSRHDDDKSDPVGTALFTAIIVLLAIIVLVQIGIAKGRQMERDEMWKSFPYNIVFQNITGHKRCKARKAKRICGVENCRM